MEHGTGVIDAGRYEREVDNTTRAIARFYPWTDNATRIEREVES